MSLKKIHQIKEKYGTDDIVEMVHTFLTEENAQNQQRRIEEGRLGKFYPSSVGRCQRAVAYQMQGYPTKPINGQSLLIMENGTSFHNRMEDIFERMGILIAPELSLKHKELRISGRSDAIIWNFLLDKGEPPGEEISLFRKEQVEIQEGDELKKVEEDIEVYRGPNNHILIVEFKSIKSKNFHKLPKTKPEKKHEMQLQLYFKLTGIRRGLVYYENKDTQETKYYFVEYDEAMVEETIAYIKDIIRYVDGHDLPEREGNPLDIMCRYCDFRNICHIPVSEEEWLSIYFDEQEDAA
ncbi:CRISPR-associated protein Cas4 [Cytobacillus oceanisediminis]|uniref:CRISPR-associated protein Cas4 n=1 Tax=Cytobacillus oceanisediminis TaxID=665099 RepID=UPI001FB32315|nr:PD-(D/E)XK nuclease family protein [Cytobacillus oceanisediminis]UOE58201.1 Dna2/Cas4 domain-containing protein [Cytobacillus oceanisediminis]